MLGRASVRLPSSLYLSLSFSLSLSFFLSMTEKTMASLSVDFRLFQFRSSTFASGKKRRVFPGGSRLASFLIERFAYHGLFSFAFFCSTHLPYLHPPSRFPAPLCVHFSRDRRFHRDTKDLRYCIAHAASFPRAFETAQLQYENPCRFSSNVSQQSKLVDVESFFHSVIHLLLFQWFSIRRRIFCNENADTQININWRST